MRSALADALSFALAQFLTDPTPYRSLYRKYLGVAPLYLPAASGLAEYPSALPGGALDRIFQQATLRIGFFRNPPYHFFRDGAESGFEYELADALTARVSAHYRRPLTVRWVEKEIRLSGSGRENFEIFDQFLAWLRNGEFDVVFSGMIFEDGRPVVTLAPTMRIFPNVLYTGRDSFDLQAVQTTDRQTLVSALSRLPPLSLLSTAGGPSERYTAALADDVRKAGGSAETITGTTADIRAAVTSQNVHFIIGDGIALSAAALAPGFGGLNLNVDVGPDVVDVIAPFTLPDASR